MAISAARKFATRRSVARQSAIALKLSTNQRSEPCGLRERGRRHHHAAERGLAAEIQRRGDEDRHDARDPAESGRHPGEVGEAANEPAHGDHDVAEMHFDAAALVGLACRERNAVDVLVDADEREAQVRLARVAVGVAPDQAPAHEIAQQRAHHGIRNGGPQHETRHRVVDAADAEREVLGNGPEHAREAHEQHARTEEPGREIERQLAELARVFGHALIGVHAHGTAARGEPERTTRSHPELEQIARQTLAKAKLGGLVEPALRDVENEQAPDDHEVHAELVEKIVQVAAGDRIVERLVPAGSG